MNTPSQPRVLSDREFVLEHTFHAPASKVFAAYTDASIVPRWWAPRGGTMRVEALDARPGGAWRFVQRMPNGREVALHGTYLEVSPVTRLVYTLATEGQPGELRATVELAEHDGVTRLVLTTLCPSKEARDAMLQYGAAAGAKAAWSQLADVLGGARA